MLGYRNSDFLRISLCRWSKEARHPASEIVRAEALSVKAPVLRRGKLAVSCFARPHPSTKTTLTEFLYVFFQHRNDSIRLQTFSVLRLRNTVLKANFLTWFPSNTVIGCTIYGQRNFLNLESWDIVYNSRKSRHGSVSDVLSIEKIRHIVPPLISIRPVDPSSWQSLDRLRLGKSRQTSSDLPHLPWYHDRRPSSRGRSWDALSSRAFNLTRGCEWRFSDDIDGCWKPGCCSYRSIERPLDADWPYLPVNRCLLHRVCLWVRFYYSIHLPGM